MRASAVADPPSTELLRALFHHVPPGWIEVRVIEDRRRGKLFDRRWCESAEVLLAAVPSLLDVAAQRSAGVFLGVLPRREKGSGKNEDVLPGMAAWVDLDFKSYGGGETECRAHLASFSAAPTAMVASGHGLHCYWLFHTPQEPSILGSLSRRLGASLGGDHVADAARLLRLPGSINRKEGYEPVLVTVEQLDLERRYEPADLEALLRRARPVQSAARRGKTGRAPANVAVVDAIPASVRELLESDERLYELFQGNGKPSESEGGAPLDTSSSGYDFTLVCELVKLGVTGRAELAAVLSHRPGGEARKKDLRYIERTVEKALAACAKRVAQGQLHRYRETKTGIVWLKATANGDVEVPLTNFTARIVSEVVHDDGAEERFLFELEASLGDRSSRFTIPAERFAGVGWVPEKLGSTAIVSAGSAIKDHTRAAIQTLSGTVSRRHVYRHTGWCEMNGERLYLHGGGAIGPDGAGKDVKVDLPGELGGFLLPEVPSQADLREAVAAAFSILDVTPGRITAPLLAAVFRAVLGPSDFSLHLSGQTGAGKTELAALAQQFFGANMDARHLPGSWLSTGNSLEATAFLAKDAILVVDDFAPGGSTVEMQRMHRQADRYLRAQGNRAGRGRMAPDGTQRPVRSPRGLTISTGEDVPHGESLRARLLILELAKGDLDWNKLTMLQAAARAGRLAQAMAGYVQWLAPKMEALPPEFREAVAAMRSILERRSHRRTASIEAELLCATKLFLEFAVETGTVTVDQRLELSGRLEHGIAEAAEAQAQHQVSADPVVRFLELLRSALSSGLAHVARDDGSSPADAGTWGWREHAVGTGASARNEWEPQGARIGWADGDHVYLDLAAACRAAQNAAGGSGEGLTVGRDTLAVRLKEKGLLVLEGDGRHLTVRRVVEGKRRRVYELRVTTLFPDSEDGEVNASVV